MLSYGLIALKAENRYIVGIFGHQLRPPDFPPFAGLINATSGPLPLLAQLMRRSHLPTSARCC